MTTQMWDVGRLRPLVLVLGTGFCGAFTTVSSFAVETVRLGEDDETGRAVLNATGTLAGAVAAGVSL
jgi:CrcB protein